MTAHPPDPPATRTVTQMALADRLTRVSSSQTQQVLTAAEGLRRQGVDVIDLGAGEPDFATPPHVKAAGTAAIAADFTKYTPNAGIAELKEAICARYLDDYGTRYTPAETIVTAGGKQALFNVAMSLFGPGDEVITHAPAWPSIVEQIKIAGAEPVLVRTYPDEGFRVAAARVLDALSARTRAIIINSPGNPTGALVAEEELATIAREASTRGIWVIVDLCYERLIYDDVPHNLPRVLGELARDRGVLIGSVSKTYAMTGWRCGWALGPEPLIAAANTVQSHATSNVCSITQQAAVAALTGPQACVQTMLDEYRTRRDRLCAWLAAEARIRVVPPAGAFYLFPDITEVLSPDGPRTSAEFASRLLAEAHVALTAGEAFDAPGFLRVSYATSLARLEEGATRLLRFVATLNPS